MNLKNAIDKLKYDARMVDINLKNQTLTTDDLKKYLGGLQDMQGQCVQVDLESLQDEHDSMNGYPEN